MFTFVSILFFILCLSGTHAMAKKWVKVSDGEKTKDGAPKLKKLKSNKISLDLNVETPGFYVSEQREDARIFQVLELGKYNGDLGPGFPNLPVQRQYVYIPNGKTAKFKVKLGKVVTLDDYMVYPVQPAHPDAKGAPDHGFVIDDDIYASNRSFPTEQVVIDEIQHIRGHQVALLHICPYSYNPTQRVLKVYPDMEISVSFKGKDKKVKSGLASNSFDKFIKGIVLNPEAYSDYQSTAGLSAASEAGAEYLIITAPAFLAAANSLSAHKTNIGINTIVKTTNDTGTSVTAITNYIQDAFDNWTTAPSYVLLLGDAEFIPTHYQTIHSYHGSYTGTDLYYSTLSGSDYIPDIFLGRIPVDTLAEANLVVQKIINYETNPPSLATSAAVAGYFQDGNYDGYADRRFVLTSEEVRNFLLTKSYSVERIYYTPSSVTPTNWNNGTYANGAPIPTELLRSSGFAWDGNAADITASINSGISFLLHRDHGADRNAGYSHTGWADPEYDETHINGLSNGSLLPVVFSINCMTGWFDGETDAYSSRNYESFCELFLTKSGGGAVAAFGASRVSYSGHNDFLAEGFFDCVWPEFLPSVPNNSGASTRLGNILNHGKLAMDTIWGDPWGVRLTEYEIFHVFGDPTMQMIANTSTTPTVTVTSPNGGENWEIGTVHAITWSSSGISSTVNIDYSSNGGSSWTAVAGSVANTGSYNWTIPNTPSGNCLVRVSDSGGSPSDTSNAAFTISDGVVTYCASSGNNQYYEWIGGVAVANVNNPSGKSGYSDFTSLTANLTKGANSNFTLTPDFGSGDYTEYWRIWVDYNQNGSFDDAGELVYSGASKSAISNSFLVPTSAQSGTTRMRVSMKYSGYSASCGSFTYGEVEDYSVNIQ